MRTAIASPSFVVWAVCVVMLAASQSTREARGQVLALEAAGPLTGNQNFGGNLGMDFVVNLPIEVTALGVFDSDQNGIDFSTDLEVEIWERDDNGTPDDFSDDTGISVLVNDIFFEGNEGTLEGVYRVRDLADPITLEPGNYTLNAFGYAADEPLFNSGGNPALPAPTPNEASGAIRFVGVSRFGTQGPGTFPETPDGGPPARYFAGTFKYIPPEADAFLSIEVDRDSGAISMRNGTAEAVDLLGYSLRSGVGALDPAMWTTVADNYDADGDMSVDSDDTWRNLTSPSSRFDLSEFEFDGGNGGTLDVGQSISLGTGPWIRHPSEDVTFHYVTPDGTRVEGIVNFVGGNDSPFAFGDLNFDGTPYTLDDFVEAMLPNLVSSPADLSQAEAYHRGDLDGDLDVDREDFRLFKQNFLAAGGSAEALSASAARVPEPTSFMLAVLLLVGIVAASVRRAPARQAMVRVVLGALLLSPGATSLCGQIIALDNPGVGGVQNFSGDLGMDFIVNEYDIEVVSLGAFDSNQDGWFSEITVELWSRDDAGTPSVFTDDTGLEILASEVFNDMDEGTLVGGSRFRDLAAPVTLQPGTYTIVARGYGADELLANNGQGSPLSTINDFGGVLQFVGGSRFGTNNTFPNVEDGGPSNRYLAGTFAYEVDIEPLVLEVNTTTGAVTLLNEGATTFEIDFYELKSPAGMLDPAGWTSLADQNVEGWLEGGASNDTGLVEANLTSSLVLANGASHSLGMAFNELLDGPQDIEFEYTTISGIDLEAVVRYVMGDLLAGDYNASGQVEQADLDLVLLNWGDSTPPVPAGWTNDLPQAQIDQAELDRVLLNWGNTAGLGRAASAVPEPSALAMVALAALLAVGSTLVRPKAAAARVWASAGRISQSAVQIAQVALAFAALHFPMLASHTNDRSYEFGDAALEDASAGLTVGRGPTNPTFGGTLDSAGPTGAFVDLLESGGPTYVDVSDRPGAAAGALGIQFDGEDDYLFGPRLGLPSTSISADPLGPLDYSGISNRGFQLWVRPEAAGAGAAQNIVMDTNQHGLRISDNDTWTMRYAGADFDSGAAVEFGEWAHLMVVRPLGAAGGARMYLNGVAVAAAAGGYDGADDTQLVVGSNTGNDIDVLVGTEDFFQGTLDDLSLFIFGTSTANATDYGTFHFLEDNQFASSGLTGVEGDVNQDGNLDQVDVDAFVSGWLAENRVGGIVVGDLQSYRAGDLNIDGITDLDDAFLLHSALVSAGQAGLNFEALTEGVPEPGSLMLLALGVGTFFAFRLSRLR